MTAARVADLQLRGPSGPLRARVHWPDSAPALAGSVAPPALLVLFPGDHPADVVAECVSRGAGVVVLSAFASDLDDAATATRWAADHGRELEADPGRMFLGGIGTGVELASGVDRMAKQEGWPPVAGQLHLGHDVEVNEALIRDLRTWLALGGGRAAS